MNHYIKVPQFLLTAAATIHFDGSQHVTFNHPGNGVSEAELLNFRFRTSQNQGLLFTSRDDTSADRLQIYLGEYPFSKTGFKNSCFLFAGLYPSPFRLPKRPRRSRGPLVEPVYFTIEDCR